MVITYSTNTDDTPILAVAKVHNVGYKPPLHFFHMHIQVHTHFSRVFISHSLSFTYSYTVYIDYAYYYKLFLFFKCVYIRAMQHEENLRVVPF